MTRKANIFYAGLVFLVGLIVSRALLAAFLVTLVFWLGTVFFEAILNSSKVSAEEVAKGVLKILTPVILALGFYILFFLPLEFLLTEHWLKIVKVPSLVSLVILFLLVFIFNLFDWGRMLSLKRFRFFLCLFLVFCGGFYFYYRREKLAREYLPKIYEIDPDWGIQAGLVEIRGVNFYPEWRRGRVVFGDQEMIVKSWDDKLVVAEMGVPAEFGLTHVCVLRADGIMSNLVEFEVRNPASLNFSRESDD